MGFKGLWFRGFMGFMGFLGFMGFMGFRVWGLGFRVQGLGLGVRRLEFRAYLKPSAPDAGLVCGRRAYTGFWI